MKYDIILTTELTGINGIILHKAIIKDVKTDKQYFIYYIQNLGYENFTTAQQQLLQRAQSCILDIDD